MPIALALALALQPPGADLFMPLPEAGTQDFAAALVQRGKPLEPPKLSPKKFPSANGDAPWEFPWLTSVVADDKASANPAPILRFGVFSQDRKSRGDLAGKVARMLARLWQLNQAHLGFGNPKQFRNGAVDVYLCWGGKAGGEQMFASDSTGGNRPVPVNTIYIYDLASFGTPIEMAREVAHEYGHACIPPAGGYQQPEYWANGFLGEKLFLLWMRDAIASGKLIEADAMDASVADLDAWLRVNVLPLVAKAASTGPDLTLLKQKSAEAMAAYHGLVLYAATLFPKPILGRSLLLTGSQNAWDYPKGLMMAVQELEKIKLSFPPALRGRSVWIPLGKGRLFGAQQVARKGDWVQVRAGKDPVTIIPATP